MVKISGDAYFDRLFPGRSPVFSRGNRSDCRENKDPFTTQVSQPSWDL